MPDQRNVLITGSGRGIGAATARLLAHSGYRVCINYLNDSAAADALANELKDSRPLVIQADVSSEQDVDRLFHTIDNEMGQLDALVNNAAVLSTQARVESLTADRINRILSTNVTGAFMCCRQAVQRLSTARGGKGGAIVNVSSLAAKTGAPGEYVDYAASKAAIDALTRGLSKEVATDGIRVNAVRPGFIDTDMHADGGEPDRINRLKERIPMKRGGTADEVAQAIAWLLSDDASYVTGSFIDIAGGY